MNPVGLFSKAGRNGILWDWGIHRIKIHVESIADLAPIFIPGA